MGNNGLRLVYNKDNNNASVLFVIFCLTVWTLIVGLLAYYFGSIQNLNQTEIDTYGIYEDWLTYKNDQYGYSIMYPSNWLLNESDPQSCEAEAADCHDLKRGEKVTIRNKQSNSVLKIDYSNELIFYSVLKKRNLEENPFHLWGENLTKGYVSCTIDKNQVTCNERNENNEILFALFYSQFGNDPEKFTENSWSLSDPEGREIKVFEKYEKYNKSDDMLFDLILHTMQYSS